MAKVFTFSVVTVSVLSLDGQIGPWGKMRHFSKKSITLVSTVVRGQTH